MFLCWGTSRKEMLEKFSAALICPSASPDLCELDRRTDTITDWPRCRRTATEHHAVHALTLHHRHYSTDEGKTTQHHSPVHTWRHRAAHSLPSALTDHEPSDRGSPGETQQGSGVKGLSFGYATQRLMTRDVSEYFIISFNSFIH